MQLSASFRAAIAIAELLCCETQEYGVASFAFDVDAGAVQKNQWVVLQDDTWHQRVDCETRKFEIKVYAQDDDDRRCVMVLTIILYRDMAYSIWSRADIEVSVIGNVFCTHHYKALFDSDSRCWRVRRVLRIGTFGHLNQLIEWSNEFSFADITYIFERMRQQATTCR